MITETLNRLTPTYWTVALQGVAALVFGTVLWVWPGTTLAVLLALFGAYAFLNGLAALYGGAAIGSWGLILGGLVGVDAGIIAFFYPGITAVVLLEVIAAWAILTGVMEILAGIELRRAIEHEWLLIVSGVISGIFGGVLAIHPGSGALAIVWLIGAYAILVGIAQLARAYRFWRWR